MDSPPEYDWHARLVALTEALEQGEQPVDVNLEPDGNNQPGHVPRQPAEPAPETAGADTANKTRETAMSPAPEELITPHDIYGQSANIRIQLEERLVLSLSARCRVIPTQGPRGTGDVVQPSRWPRGNIRVNRVSLYRTPEPGQDTRDIVRDLLASVRPDNDTIDETGSDSDEECI